MLLSEIVRVDSDGHLYKKEDTHWACLPTFEDPGYLVPNDGAIPVDLENRWYENNPKY